MKDLIDQVLRETDHANNPYFEALRKNELAKADFVETQIQFYFAVAFFNRPMAALAARIPNPALRMEVLRNVWEENGEGDPRRSHRMTFLEFLRRLGGVTEEEVEQRALWPEVRIFNTTLAGACALDDYLVGCALLGIIERMFCEISGWIGRDLVSNGWLAASELIHYTVHEALDVKHAQDLFDVVLPAWEAGGGRYLIEQGLRMGATVFDDLYRDLYAHRHRRALMAAAPAQPDFVKP